MTLTFRIESLLFVVIAALVSLKSPFSIAQEDSNSITVQDQLIQLLRMTDKELMIRQDLADVPLSEALLKTIDQQGYIDNVTETGAVISSLGNAINCYLETRFLLNDKTRYDEANDVLLGSFHPDKKASNTLCNNFSNRPEATQCTIDNNGATTAINGDQLIKYHELCVKQIAIVLSVDEEEDQ